MIFKLQKPVMTNGGADQILAYAQGRQHMRQLTLTQSMELMFGPKLKIYVEAEISGEHLVIEKVVADRSW